MHPDLSPPSHVATETSGSPEGDWLRYGVIGLVQNAQHFGFCRWTPGINCQAGPTGCYESLPADEHPTPRE